MGQKRRRVQDEDVAASVDARDDARMDKGTGIDAHDGAFLDTGRLFQEIFGHDIPATVTGRVFLQAPDALVERWIEMQCEQKGYGDSTVRSADCAAMLPAAQFQRLLGYRKQLKVSICEMWRLISIFLRTFYSPSQNHEILVVGLFLV